jgi:heme oxygenase
VRPAIADMLRRRTASSHRNVEVILNLLDPELTPSTLRNAIQCLADFWRDREARVGEWAAEQPQLALELDWPRRRRTALYAADLTALAGPSSEPVRGDPSAWAERPSTGDVLAWLYVAEGSTLGGAVIARRLRSIPSLADLHLASFSPYPEGPGPMWRRYQDVLARWTGEDDERRRAVVDSAGQVFEQLEHWTARCLARAVA